MELYKILLRVIVAYVCLLALLRLSGKRTVRQASALDFVLVLIIGDMIDNLLWAEVAASQFITGTGTLVVVHLLFSMGCYASDAFARLVRGRPSVFLRSGEIDHAGARRERLNDEAIESLVKQKEGLARGEWGEVRLAVIEPSGEVSVLREEGSKPAERRDLGRLREVLDR